MTPLLVALMTHANAVPVAIYLAFGAAGTALHLWRSPVLEFGRNRQTVVRLLMGASVGAVLPYAGSVAGHAFGMPEWVSAEVPLVIKGLVVFIMSLGGSYVLGDELARRAIAKAKKEEEDKP